MYNMHLIFGAPGCGKTTHLVKLLTHLLEQYAPDETAFVSFTKKGSYEGRDRAIEQFNLKASDFPYFRTIHSLAFRDLGISRYEMISKRNYRDFSKAMGMSFVGYYTEDFVNNDDKYLFHYSLVRNNPAMAERHVMELDFRKFGMVSENFTRFKKEMGIMDFDDLLIDFVRSGSALPVKVAIIDEAQDLTTLQWAFCELAFRDCEKVFIAGDDDQAIYEWSGADVSAFVGLMDYSNVTMLDKSYRLRKNVLEFARTITNRIDNRVTKYFEPVSDGGTVSFYNQIEDIDINSEESYYFLSRNNYFLKDYRALLRKKGLVFHDKNKYSVDMGKYEAIKRYENLRKNAPGKIGADVGLKAHLKKDAKKGAVWYDAFELSVEESNYYRDLFRDKTDVTQSNLTVNTIHGVKGGEADNVVLRLDVTKNVAKNIDNNLDAELRCIYVALTRAKKNVHIVHSKTKHSCKNLFIT